MVEIEARIGQDAEGLQSTIDEQRALVTRLRTDLETRREGGSRVGVARSSSSTRPSGGRRSSTWPSGCGGASAS